ncbi:LysR substrate-binding domain-containing protein [Dongia sp.]|uniref:LysR substrate-binding domain-containing protein n=1 Tax=Dongia sp. TaxID=1977262 RepID=UPI0034A38B9D
MDKFHELEVFVAVADAGSFARAGARLNISPPAVTRAISSLEGRLDAQVFNRTTRSLSLTEVGARFLENARRLLAEMETAEKEAVGETAVPSGHLALTASVTFGRLWLAPVVCAFLEANPRITASIALLDRVANMVEEGFDVAIRIGSLPDSTVIARRVGEVRRLLVASPTYLAKRGVPQSPADLKLHSIIAFTGLMPNREWRHIADGATGQVSLLPRLEINDAAFALAAAEKGDGITMALSYMVAEQIRKGRLVPVLEKFTPPPVPVQIVYPQARILAPKIRAFVDFATPGLTAALGKLWIPIGLA